MTVDSPKFNFLTRRPSPPLDRFVESLWYARGTAPYRREKIAPTGSSVAVIVLGDPILQTPNNGKGTTILAEKGVLLGPHHAPVINEPTGETFAVGIVTTPVGCEAVFGVPPASVRGQAINLEAAWPQATHLRGRLPARETPEDMLSSVETYLADTHDSSIPGLERCERAVAMLEADPTRPIAEIASDLAVSHGHLDREFTRVVGLSPRVLARLLRLQRLLREIDVGRDIEWTDLALELGWFDQAHLIRDFRRHTGVTPSQYVNAQRSALAPSEFDDAAGFVPET
jgi:AraC-like DNA-binding protein